MTTSTTTGGAPLVVGLGGTLRASSSTERALRYCLDSVERQGGRAKFFSGPDLDLPMYAPHELERTPKALELVNTLREADAVVVGSPGYHGAVSGLVKNALDDIEDLREDLASTSTTLRGAASAAHSDGRRRSAHWGSCAASGMRCARGRLRSE